MTSCTQLPRAATLLPFVLAVLVIAGCASRSHQPAGSSIGVPSEQTVTQLHRFAPARTIPVSAPRLAGTCWTTSIAVPRKGVYRCLASNKILDPCYPTTTRGTVACYIAPWSTPTYLTLTAALPRAGIAVPGSRPWAIRLADGQQCVAVTGTVQIVGNIALSYACGNGGAAGLVASTDRLRTAFYRADATGALQQVAVNDIWTG